MARWTIAPRTEGNSMTSKVEYGDKDWDGTYEVHQDVSQILEEVKLDKELLNQKQVGGYRKMCTIPDIVAIEMLANHRLDIHDPNFMNDPNNMKKLKRIIQTEYPYLLIST